MDLFVMVLLPSFIYFTFTDKSCKDIDECELENDCDANAECFNTHGSYNCTCKIGYEGNGTVCAGKKIITKLLNAHNKLDINECERGTAGCDNNANCTNYQGNFTCECNSGYFGNGSFCDGNFILFCMHFLKFYSKISMNVTSSLVIAVPMLRAIIPLDRTTVLVCLVLMEMATSVTVHYQYLCC